MHAYLVMVVDEDARIRKGLEAYLSLDGFRPAMAASGQEAFSLFDARRPDILLLGLSLPDMDGLQVCRAIRAASEVPIILLSTRDGVSDKVLGLESGADDYLVKPFDYLELAARIRARLRRREAFRKLAATTRVGTWRLVPQRREVALPGRTVPLTKRQFDLLSLFFDHVGRVLDRETIRAALWPDAQIYCWSRAIDVHVHHLRAKLEEDPATPTYIVTVPGVGYQLRSAEEDPCRTLPQAPPAEGGAGGPNF